MPETQTAIPLDGHSNLCTDDNSIGREALEFNLSTVLNAEAWRVRHALTIAEYIEMWIDLPGLDEARCHEAAGNPSEFRCELYSSTWGWIFLIGYARPRTTSTLRYTWQKIVGSTKQETKVDFKIMIVRGGTMLRIRHRGFLSTEDEQWYRALWESSLQKLQYFLER